MIVLQINTLINSLLLHSLALFPFGFKGKLGDKYEEM